MGCNLCIILLHFYSLHPNKYVSHKYSQVLEFQPSNNLNCKCIYLKVIIYY